MGEAVEDQGVAAAGAIALHRAKVALGLTEHLVVERGAKAAWEAFCRHTYGSFTEDGESAWKERAPLFRWMAIAVFGTIPQHEFHDKEALISGLFDVQTGLRSCRHMAAALWPTLEPHAALECPPTPGVP